VLLPTGIVTAERTLFLPSIGAMFAVGGIGAWVVERIRPTLRTLVTAAACGLVALGVYRSNLRHQIWSDQFKLWYVTANTDAPRSFRAHEAMAELLSFKESISTAGIYLIPFFKHISRILKLHSILSWSATANTPTPFSLAAVAISSGDMPPSECKECTCKSAYFILRFIPPHR
jgi:hypothetical protein